ncbi:site-specific integrase [Aliiroseovarius sp. KMU-50]|uniref:Site-specific integrase n=1 Tax=Aliiroseovarius salicola TaxID=3009082 RepID=A0ABT4W3E7_9RHOB|nr:site-specific integrase [Aliiroseovarius sp. KMU-50]MDA5095015.1 site-specific integrase [Aliiroseovarius sp. KMU-50]
MTGHQMSTDCQNYTDTKRTQRNVIRLTDKVVKGLLAPEKGSKVQYDDALKGFGLRVTATGKKAFILNYRVKGRERRLTIGGYPEWTVLGARKKAEELRREVDCGNDPLEIRDAALKAPTVHDLFERYVREHLPTKSERSQVDDLSMWTTKILPVLARKKLVDLTFTDCDALHRAVSKTAPVQANRMVALMRKSFNLANRWDWMQTNPAVGVRFNPEVKRERYLTHDEISRLLAVIEGRMDDTSAELIRFLLFTGCRRGEAFQAQWDQFNADLTVWTKPASTTKQRKLHRVPVSSVVTALLEARRRATTSDYVFAGKTGQPLRDVKKTWQTLCRNADLVDVRLHDLRHTFASLLASNGQTLPTIGAMLGHSQTQTTARYAHLFDDSLANAAEIVAERVQSRQPKTMSDSRLKR